MGNMKYKVGDKVRIKSLDWYNENKDELGNVGYFSYNMKQFCGQVVTISKLCPPFYCMENINIFLWTDEMIEGLVERNGKTYPYKIGDRVVLKGNNKCATITDLKYNSSGNLSYYIKIDNDKDIGIDYPTDLLLPYDNTIEGLVEEEMPLDKAGQITDFEYEGLAYTLPDGYQFVDDNGNVINTMKIVLKKKEYPKTYEECNVINDRVNKIPLKIIGEFTRLINTRNAYWKIAGEEMGLEKPWEPGDNKVFGIIRQHGKIQKYNDFVGDSTILEFPTEEMRDAFYENFKELIESVKELL